MSVLRRRIYRYSSKKSEDSVINMDITSLLDILVILLVFLLKSYQSSNVVINIPKGIKLPYSKSNTQNQPGTLIQVSPEKLWVDDEMILNVENLPPKIYDQNNRRIIPLYNQLVQIRERIEGTSSQTQNAVEFSGIANLVVDESIDYNYLRKVLYTCAQAGFKQYNLSTLLIE